MKKFFPLCLLLIVALVWTVSVAGSLDKAPTASKQDKAIKVQKAEQPAVREKAVPEKQATIDGLSPDEAARLAREAEEMRLREAEGVQSNGTPGVGIPHEPYPSISVESEPGVKINLDRTYTTIEYEDALRNGAEYRMYELKADGVIDASERAEYEQLLAETPVVELPNPLNIVTEVEPNNTCDSAQAVACGDTVWCATHTSGTDDHDWYTFTLAADQNVFIETHPTAGACDPAMSDTYLELWTGDCATMLASDDDGGVSFFSLIAISLTAGTYAIHSDNSIYAQTGSYHLSITCCDAPVNDNCADVTPVALTTGVPYTFTGNNECSTNECPSFPGPHVWVAFTTPIQGNISLEYCNSTGVWLNAWLNLAYGCPCDSFTTGASFGFTCPDGNLQMQWNSLPAATYYYPVMLDPVNGSVGDYSITVQVDQPPTPWSCVDDPPNYVPPDGKLPGGVGDIEPNDLCAEASPAQCEYAYCGDLSSSTDVDWYVLTIPADTTYSLHIRVFANDTPNQYAYLGGCDPWVGLFESDCVTMVASNEDYYGTFPDAEGYDSQINASPGPPNCFLPGSTVYIQIATNYSAPGPYLLIINCEPCEIPSEYGSWFCPPNTLFGQEPSPPGGSWSFGTSEIDVNGSVYKRFESYTVSGEITDIHFWGAKLFLSGSWMNCTEEPMTFLIEFWNDDGTGYPDIANPPVCSYTMAIPALPMDSLYSGVYNAYEWSADLPQPCTLSTGYVSIQGQLDNTCWFLWLSSPYGDGSSWFLSDGVWTAYAYDNSICLTGIYQEVYGACCDDQTGICTDNVEQLNCPYPLRFAANTLCADLDPPCGQIPGACCDPATATCVYVTDDSCAALGWIYIGDYVSCDPNPCPLPGDNCLVPLVVPSIPYSDLNQYTCGRGNYYDATCLDYYDGGEDIIYEFTLAQDTCIEVTVDFKSTTWTGFAVDDNCPPDLDCIAVVTGSASGVKTSGALDLAAGTYYIMVDTWPSPTCIPDFDLFINLVDCPGPDWSCVDDPPNYVPPDNKLPGGVGDIEPNDLCTEASPAQCEYAYCGDIATTTDVDWYTITLPADTTYGLHIRVFGDDTPHQYANGLGLDPWVGLYASDCTTLVAQSEDYFGTFPDAETYDSQINPGGANCFAPGEQLYIAIQTNYSAPGPYLLIINCVPCELPGPPWSCVDDPPNWAPPDGKLPGGIGDIEPNDTCVDASEALCEYAYCGAVDSIPDSDWYRVILPTDGTYGLHVRVFANDTPNQYAQGGGCDPWVGLYASDCVTLVTSNEDYGGTFPDAELYDSQINPGGANCFLPGDTVYLEILTNYSAPGPYLLIINCVPCEIPTGACCVDYECVATNYESECDALGGEWAIGETCPDFQCVLDCNAPGLVYANGENAPVISQYNIAQCDVAYPFQFATADDFEFPGTDSVEIANVITWTWHWNGTATPGDYEGVNVVIYNNDAISYPGTNMPAGEPVDGDPNCSHIENIPNGIVYMTTLTPGSFNYINLGTSEYLARLELPVDVKLAAGVKYWLEVEPIMQFGLAGQVGTRNSDLQTGDYCMRFAPMFGDDPWTTQGDSVDMAFCLLGPAGGACDYVTGDVNGSDSYNGLDITYGVAYFKGGSDPICPFGSCPIPPCDAFFYCGDVNASCSYNGLDITYGVAYFKGGDDPIPCPDCPPSGGPASDNGGPETPSVIKTKPVFEQNPGLK